MTHSWDRARQLVRPESRRISGLTIFGVVCLYVWISLTQVWEPGANPPSRQLYNLQTDGFLAGQLHMKEPVPAGLLALSNPYDPTANARFRDPRADGSRLHDVSYYDSKLYLYFGVTPIVVLFGPWLLLTGGHFPQELAVLVFCCAGFVVAASLYARIARECFPGVSNGVVAAGIGAIGLASGLSPLVFRPDVYEVAISCGYAFAMVTLALVWKAMGADGAHVRWLALASLAYGLAVAARPSLLPGALVLLVPIAAHRWNGANVTGGRSRMLRQLTAAVLPIGVVGMGLMWLNFARFGSVLEFGQKYQLAGFNIQESPPLFNPAFIPYNLRTYFLQPVTWGTGSFLPVGVNAAPNPPATHLGIENPYGALTSVPFAWLALALILVRGGTGVAVRVRWMVAGLLVLFIMGMLVLSAFGGACARYQAEFLPPLILLAAVGLVVIERRIRTFTRWGAAIRGIWGSALVYSLITGLLVGASSSSPYHLMRSRDMWALLKNGYVEKPLARFESLAVNKPDVAQPHSDLGYAYLVIGRIDDAIERFQRALKIDPGHVHSYNGMGEAFLLLGRNEEARHYFMRSLELRPNNRIAVEKLNQLGKPENRDRAVP